MIKVRILTGVAAAGAAVLSIPSLAGCSADAADDSVGTGTENNTEAIAGSGSIDLHGWTLHYGSTTGGDEFIRIGEKMKVAFDYAHVVTHFIAVGDDALAQTLRADPSLVEAKIKVTYSKFDGSTFDALLPVTWGPGFSNLTFGRSDEFTIPKQVKSLRLEIVVKYTRSGQVRTEELLGRAQLQRDFVVFGAFVPNKLAFFDTMGAEKRMRILEGGTLVRGAKVTLSVADWRLDTLVDKSSLDLYYGDRLSGSRFGPTMVPGFGRLEYEVEAVVSADGGASWNSVGLQKIDKPDVLSRNDGFRFALQKEIAIAQNAGSKLKVAFHIKAFLQVPDYGTEVSNARHPRNARILLRDVWDNNGGQDYSLPIGNE